MNGPDIQKHLNAELARLFMELATAKALIEWLESQIPTPPKDDAGRSEG